MHHLIMVKFFTQSCPKCLTQPSSLNDAKCLCIVKGHLVAARGYVEGGDKEKTPKKEEGPEASTTNPEKSNEELFIENTKRALELLKKESDKAKKKPKEDD